VRCEICGGEKPTRTIPVCPSCSKKEAAEEFVPYLHRGVERIDGEGRFHCNICSNMCGFDDEGLCGLRRAEGGRLKLLSTGIKGVVHPYYDPLPTNCCNSWFCRGSSLKGVNLALFYYGCNFDCLFCQNYGHKRVEEGEVFTVEELASWAADGRVRCLCHFGGSPEPQMPFAIRLSREVLKERDVMICWEWNGAGKPSTALAAARLSSESGGLVKFDLKAYSPTLHRILTGRGPERVWENFSKIYDSCPEVLSATTLMVPYYVDEEEVGEIARFIASFSDDIPYSLLIFHPDYRLADLPITPRSQVERCYLAAKKHLKRVNIGNIHLLSYAPP